MGFVSRIIEAIQYIREHGWKEYRAARARYDKHTKAVSTKPTKRERIDFIKSVKKMQKGK
jgi:hypothetical protein